MAYTEDQLTALEIALARGEHRVTFADKTVEYRSVEDLKAAIREVKRGLKITNLSRQIRVTSNKGF
jgi:hypothetical protein